MKELKKAADGDTSILYVALIALGIGLLFATMCHSQTPVTTRQEFLSALSGDMILLNDIDLTGEQSLPVNNSINGNGKTIHYKSLPASGEVFLFMVNGGTLSNITIFGPNGNVMADGGTFGAVRVLTGGGSFNYVNFINCDKYGIYNAGVRLSQDDVAYITGCTFTGIKRVGWGYGIWTQYGYSVVRHSVFQNGRHAIDGSSEANQYDIQYCTFAGNFYNYPIHLHEYTGAKSGIGFTFKHNYVFGKSMPIDIHPPFSGKTVIDSNYFEALTIGRIGTDQIVVGSNFIGGVKMSPAPVTTQAVSYKVGERIAPIPVTATNCYYPDGKPALLSKVPRVKCFGVYSVTRDVRSITGYYTVSVTDTGKYTGMWIKCYKTSVEVYVNGVLHERLSPSKWSQYLYRGVVTFKVVGEAGGECYIDDFCKSGTFETFELTNKIKIYGYEGTVKASRFAGESASGLWSFKFGFVSGGSVRCE